MSKDMAFDHYDESLEALENYQERIKEQMQERYEQSFDGRFEKLKQELVENPKEAWDMMTDLMSALVLPMSEHDVPIKDDYEITMESRCKRLLDLIHDLTN